VSPPDVRSFTVGPVQENSYILRGDASSNRALMVDPGDEPERLLEAVEALGVTIEAILITRLLSPDRAGRTRRRDEVGASGVRSVREL
jgi:hypothetical protein